MSEAQPASRVLDPFTTALTAQYREDPCGSLPNALWKTLARAPSCQTRVVRHGAAVVELQMHRHNHLYLYWHARQRAQHLLPLLQGADFALLHQDYLDQEAVARLAGDRFNHRQAYFRLIHRHKQLVRPILPPGFAVRPVEPQQEAARIAEVIDRCYSYLQPSPATVLAWVDHPTYLQDLWVWLWDTTRAQPAALGIAELDQSIGEGSLEWIQVLPSYRGRGLGAALVALLLQRLAPLASFTTVSGRCDANGGPEGFYRRAGFSGRDVWHVLRRDVAA